MADNLTYSGTGSTPPANTVQRTDDLGAAGHVPYVKLLDGTDSGTGVIPGDATNGLDVDVTRSALPSGAATSALQSTSNTALAAIQTAVEALDNTVAGNELQVDLVGAVPAGNNNIGDVDIASLPNEGQQNMAGSISVAIASDQTAVPVSAASLPLPTGGASSAKQDTIIGHVDGIEALLTTIDGDTSALAGAIAGTEVQVDIVGALPAGANAIGKLAANSGVDIGDVDVTSLPAITGTVTANAGSGTFAVKETRSVTGTTTSVGDSASSVTILASNANRLGATILNDSSAILYLKLGSTASTSSFTARLSQYDYYEIPFGYTGVIDGIWASDAGGNARVTELT